MSTADIYESCVSVHLAITACAKVRTTVKRIALNNHLSWKAVASKPPPVARPVHAFHQPRSPLRGSSPLSAFPPSESGPGPSRNFMVNNKSVKCAATRQQRSLGKIFWRCSPPAMCVFKNMLKNCTRFVWRNH